MPKPPSRGHGPSPAIKSFKDTIHHQAMPVLIGIGKEDCLPRGRNDLSLNFVHIHGPRGLDVPSDTQINWWSLLVLLLGSAEEVWAQQSNTQFTTRYGPYPSAYGWCVLLNFAPKFTTNRNYFSRLGGCGIIRLVSQFLGQLIWF